MRILRLSLPISIKWQFLLDKILCGTVLFDFRHKFHILSSNGANKNQHNIWLLFLYCKLYQCILVLSLIRCSLRYNYLIGFNRCYTSMNMHSSYMCGYTVGTVTIIAVLWSSSYCCLHDLGIRPSTGCENCKVNYMLIQNWLVLINTIELCFKAKDTQFCYVNYLLGAYHGLHQESY